MHGTPTCPLHPSLRGVLSQSPGQSVSPGQFALLQVQSPGSCPWAETCQGARAARPQPPLSYGWQVPWLWEVVLGTGLVAGLAEVTVSSVEEGETTIGSFKEEMNSWHFIRIRGPSPAHGGLGSLAVRGHVGGTGQGCPQTWAQGMPPHTWPPPHGSPVWMALDMRAHRGTSSLCNTTASASALLIRVPIPVSLWKVQTDVQK